MRLWKLPTLQVVGGSHCVFFLHLGWLESPSSSIFEVFVLLHVRLLTSQSFWASSSLKTIFHRRQAYSWNSLISQLNWWTLGHCFKGGRKLFVLETGSCYATLVWLSWNSLCRLHWPWTHNPPLLLLKLFVLSITPGRGRSWYLRFFQSSYKHTPTITNNTNFNMWWGLDKEDAQQCWVRLWR